MNHPQDWAAEQERVNSIGIRDVMAAYIAAIAEEAHNRHPQYDGHWHGDQWQVVIMTDQVVTVLGVAFEPGDITIARRSAFTTCNEWVAYSIRNATDTVVVGAVCPADQLSLFLRSKAAAVPTVNGAAIRQIHLRETSRPDWFIDQNGVGWGRFFGTITSQCSICRAGIVSGFRSEVDRVPSYCCSSHFTFGVASGAV